VQCRDTVLEEMDQPAVLARVAELCRNDELAHANSPGVEHAKRFEDVEAALSAEIDVFSTVNIQHLENLNDQVPELTGVRVRETLPDAILTAADEVVIVDLTPQALTERLRAGKVYPAERVSAAVAAPAAGAALVVVSGRHRTLRPARGGVRILFPSSGGSLSRLALDAAVRIARAEGATLLPAYLASVPLHLPLDAALTRECNVALPLLEAVEQRATNAGVAVDSRIQRGRTYRHAVPPEHPYRSRGRLAWRAPIDNSRVRGAARGSITKSCWCRRRSWRRPHSAGLRWRR
jgi:hypothetical protein